MLQYSVKTNNPSLFHKCNSDMTDLVFDFDGPNYSRSLVWLDVFLSNIDEAYPGAEELLQKDGISIERSVLRGAHSVVDKTTEITFMKISKSAEGLVISFMCLEHMKDGV